MKSAAAVHRAIVRRSQPRNAYRRFNRLGSSGARQGRCSKGRCPGWTARYPRHPRTVPRTRQHAKPAGFSGLLSEQFGGGERLEAHLGGFLDHRPRRSGVPGSSRTVILRRVCLLQEEVVSHSRRKFSPEYRDEAVKLVLDCPDKSIAATARDLGINEGTLPGQPPPRYLRVSRPRGLLTIS